MTKTELITELNRMKQELTDKVPYHTEGKKRLSDKIVNILSFLKAGNDPESVLLLFHKEITKDFNEVKEKVKLC